MIPAGECLQRNQRRVVFEAEPEVRGGLDLGRPRLPDNPFPALTRWLEPLSNPKWADMTKESIVVS